MQYDEFLPADILQGKLKGPIGRDPQKVAMLALDEKRVLGYVTIYVSEAMWLKKMDGSEHHLQVFWKDGVCLGVTYFGQEVPEEQRKKIKGYDALTLHPRDRELLMKSAADQRQRYANARPAFPWEKIWKWRPKKVYKPE